MKASFLAIAYKEFLHALRNRMIVRTLLTLQIVQLILLGSIDVTTRDLPTVVVDQDHSSQSRDLVEKLRATKTYDVRFMTNSTQEARALIRAGRAKMALVIPPDFHEKRASGEGATVLALVDGSDSTASQQALASLNGLSAQINFQISRQAVASEQSSGFSPRALILFNPQGRTANYMLPGLIAMALTAFINLSAMALVSERERGTMERLLMTPLSIPGLMLGKLAPYLVLGIFNVMALLTVVRWVFQVPIRGSLALLLFAYLLYILTLLSLGLFIASSASGSPEVNQKSTLLSLPSIFLSGYIFPLTNLPLPLFVVAHFLPVTHMVEISRGIILRDAHLIDLAPHFGYFVFASTFLIWRASVKFQTTLQR